MKIVVGKCNIHEGSKNDMQKHANFRRRLYENLTGVSTSGFLAVLGSMLDLKIFRAVQCISVSLLVVVV